MTEHRKRRVPGALGIHPGQLGPFVERYGWLMSPREVADFLAVSTCQLETWRSRSEGPRYVRLGAASDTPVLYPSRLLAQWLQDPESEEKRGNKDLIEDLEKCLIVT